MSFLVASTAHIMVCDVKNVSYSTKHTLAARGLEELFFQLCCCVSILVSGGK
jgi:hypothetical protein